MVISLALPTIHHHNIFLAFIAAYASRSPFGLNLNPIGNAIVGSAFGLIRYHLGSVSADRAQHDAICTDGVVSLPFLAVIHDQHHLPASGYKSPVFAVGTERCGAVFDAVVILAFHAIHDKELPPRPARRIHQVLRIWAEPRGADYDSAVLILLYSATWAR